MKRAFAVGGLMKAWWLAGLLGVLAGCATDVPVADPGDQRLLVPRISPVPKEAVFEAQTRVRVDQAPIVVVCPEDGASAWVRRRLVEWLGAAAKPAVSQRREAVGLGHGDEAYRLVVATNGVTVHADTLKGVRHALFTYRQTWEASRGGLTLAHYTAPSARIDDWPSLAFRGIHLMWNQAEDGTTVKFMEHQLRMAAACKLNYAVVENWGTFPSERRPYMSWGGARNVPKAEIRRLAELAKELGVTVIPQLNVFGHGAMARWVSGKHAILDAHPEYQPLFEPYGGWNWCLTNPEVLRVQKDLIDEMLEAWGNPPFFHIGCDEAEPPSCSRCCVGAYRTVVSRHVGAVVAHLRARGCRALMWHDMLLRRGDARFAGFYCKGAADAEALLDSLPKDVVICDWFYRDACAEYPTLDYFKAKGFDVVTCPWDRPGGIRAQAKWVADHGMFGVLLTTWNRLTANEYCGIWENGPSAAWGGAAHGRLPTHQDIASLWRQVGWDMGLKPSDYAEFGFTVNQCDRNMPIKY